MLFIKKGGTENEKDDGGLCSYTGCESCFLGFFSVQFTDVPVLICARIRVFAKLALE